MVPRLLQWRFPGEPIVVGIVSELLPVVFAVIRAWIGDRQLAHIASGRPPMGRRLLLVLAILTLLVFETIAVRIQLFADAPASALVAAAVLYVVYLVLALLTFRPLQSEA